MPASHSYSVKKVTQVLAWTPRIIHFCTTNNSKMRRSVPMIEIFCQLCRRKSLVPANSRRLCFGCALAPGERPNRFTPIVARRLGHYECPGCMILHAGRNVGAPLCARCHAQGRVPIPSRIIRVPSDFEVSSSESFSHGHVTNDSDESDEFLESFEEQDFINFGGPAGVNLLAQQFDGLSFGQPVSAAVQRLLDRGLADSELCNSKCSICLIEFVPRDPFIRLHCSHAFHDDCLTRWMRGHNTCPLCRILIC